MSEKIVAIAGASGFIGRAIARRLAAMPDIRVRGMTRSPERARQRLDLPNLEWVRAEVTEPSTLPDALKGAHALLLPPKASAGLFDMLWLLAWHSDALYLPRGTTVESTLPADLRTRFISAREKIMFPTARASHTCNLACAGSHDACTIFDFRRSAPRLPG